MFLFLQRQKNDKRFINIFNYQCFLLGDSFNFLKTAIPLSAYKFAFY